MIIDSTSMVWYAVVCGLLAALAPSFDGRFMRMVIGVVTGIAAASFLPIIKGMMGY